MVVQQHAKTKSINERKKETGDKHPQVNTETHDINSLKPKMSESA